MLKCFSAYCGILGNNSFHSSDGISDTSSLKSVSECCLVNFLIKTYALACTVGVNGSGLYIYDGLKSEGYNRIRLPAGLLTFSMILGDFVLDDVVT